MVSRTSDLYSAVASGLTRLKTIDDSSAESLLRTKTAGTYDLREIFDKLSVAAKEEIQANVPFYVRWFCSKSTILYRYICKNVDTEIAHKLQKSFLNHQIKMRPPPKIDVAFPPQQRTDLPAEPAAQQPARPEPAKPTASTQGAAAAAAVGPTTNEQRLANATTLTFIRHDGKQYVFRDQSGQDVTVTSSAELPNKCGKLKTLNLANCTYIGRAYFCGFPALETVDFTGCFRLGYIDVSNCPNLKTLTLSHPLPPTADGKAALIATGSPKLVPPDRTWAKTNLAEYVMRYDGAIYRYSRSTGELLVSMWDGFRPCQTPNPNILPQQNPFWKSSTEPPSPMPVPPRQQAAVQPPPFPPGKPGEIRPQPARSPLQTQAAQGPAGAAAATAPAQNAPKPTTVPVTGPQKCSLPKSMTAGPATPTMRTVSNDKLTTATDFQDAFDNLSLFSADTDPGEKAQFQKLVLQLYEKSPQMLTEILDNCRWLKGMAQDSFILSVATYSIKMELADIFAQDAYEGQIRPSASVMCGSEGYHNCFTNEVVLKRSKEKFNSWLNSQEEFPTGIDECCTFKRGAKTQSEVYNQLWRRWELGWQGNMYQVKTAIADSVLSGSCGSAEMLSDDDGAKLISEIATKLNKSWDKYLTASYAYTQLMLRHLRPLPGQEQTPPFALQAVRMVHAASLPIISGHVSASDAESFDQSTLPEKEVVTYETSRMMEAESWAMTSAVATRDRGMYGEAAIYGKIPAYSIMSSFFTQEIWAPGQKELVVLPFADVTVTAEKHFNELEYTEDVVLPMMKGQYGAIDPETEAGVNAGIETMKWRQKRN
jgi:hypothetical protein